MTIKFAIGCGLVMSCVGLLACSGSSDSKGTGGSCAKATPCGGAIEGQWEIQTLCTEGDLVSAMRSQMETLPSQCSDLFKSVDLGGTGTITFANNTATFNVTQTTNAQLVLTPSCAAALAGQSITLSSSACTLFAQQMSSSATTTCSLSGANCNCTAVYKNIDQESSGYSVSGNTIVFDTSSDQPPLDYCVAGTTLTGIQELKDLNGVKMIATLKKTN